MAGICTSTISPNGCGHRVVTIGGLTLHLHESDLTPLSEDELAQMYRLAVRHRGIALANLLNRVVVGDEATNVKQYNLIAPGVAITKTNIGTAYVNILTEVNGCRTLVEFTGCTEFRLVLNAVMPGTGVHGVRVIRDDGTGTLYENAAIAAQVAERELDTGWLPLPQGVNSLEVIRLQGKSTVGSDDPIYRRCVLLVR